MKKTKLLTSLSALMLLLSLGACDTLVEEDTSDSTVPSESEPGTDESTDEGDSGNTDTDLDGYALVGTFEDSSWDSKPSEGSKYYIPLGTTEYTVTVTMDEDPNEGYDAKFRIVEWGDSWNLVAGYDEVAQGSTGVNGEGDDKNIVVTWGATYDLVITLGENPSILVTLQEEVQEVHLLGSFDFSSNTENGTAITSSSDLDAFWEGEEGLYLGVRQYDVVYLGNGSSGAFENVTTLIKFGTSSANGSMQLKFALGTNITKVVVNAHSWYAVSENYPTQTPNQLVINGDSKDCSVSGTAEELTYEITDAFTYLLTFESVGRVTIHSIDIYGTYEPDAIEPITGLTLTADVTELNVGETAHVSVSYEPATAVFDIDTLTWTSNSNAASVTSTLTGADIRGEASGEATITATAANGVYSSVSVTVNDVLEESENIVISEINHGYSGNVKTATLTGHQVKITVDQNTDNGGDGNSNNAPLWSTSSVRVYYNQTVTFEPLYEEAIITKIVITVDGNSYVGSTSATVKDLNGNTAGTITTNSNTGLFQIDVTSSGTIVYKNVKDTSNTQLRIKAFAITYTLTA